MTPLTQEQIWQMEAAEERHRQLMVRVFNRLDATVIRAMAAIFLQHLSDKDWAAPKAPDLYESLRDYLRLVGCGEECILQVDAVMKQCAFHGHAAAYNDAA